MWNFSSRVQLYISLVSYRVEHSKINPITIRAHVLFPIKNYQAPLWKIVLLNLPGENFRPSERLSQTRPQKASGEVEPPLKLTAVPFEYQQSNYPWLLKGRLISDSCQNKPFSFPQFFQKFQLSWNNYSEKFTKKISKNKEKIKQP